MEYDTGKYPFEVSALPEDEGGGWLLSYPDVAGCIVAGDDLDQIMAEAPLVLTDCLAHIAEDGHPIPAPGSGGTYQGRISLRLPKSLHARLTLRAKAEGVSLNTMMTVLIAQGLERGPA